MANAPFPQVLGVFTASPPPAQFDGAYMRYRQLLRLVPTVASPATQPPPPKARSQRLASGLQQRSGAGLGGRGMWPRLHNTVIALASMVTFGFVAQSEERPALAQFDKVELVDVPDEFADMAGWAVGLFEEAGLRLPPLRFVHHGDDQTLCSGRRGSHRYVDGRSIVDICTSDRGKATAALLLHETAHAWAAHDLSDERKADFQSLRGWTYWRNHDAVDWHENGAEQAAEMLVWGLIDRPVGIVTISDNSCDDLDAGYRVLTGQPPLHGYRDYC